MRTTDARPGTCRSCGRDVVRVCEKTWTEPAEYECPVCDGGMDPKEYDSNEEES